MDIFFLKAFETESEISLMLVADDIEREGVYGAVTMIDHYLLKQ